jgi:putative inorganic carbon (HCO3(-)) transporter
MRYLIVVLFTVGSAFVGFIRPWFGVLALAVLAYLNPQLYGYGLARSLPVYFVVFVATFLGLLLAKDRQPFPWTRETKLFVMLLAYFTFTTMWNPDFPDPAWKEWTKVMKIYAGIFPTLWLITSRDRLRWLLMTIALSFGLVGLKGGAFALATGFRYRVWGPPDSFYGGNNEIAMVLTMCLAYAKWAKALFYGCLAFSIFSVLSTWSRGGFLTLCAVLGAMVLTGKKKWLSVPIVIAAVILLLPRLPDEWFDRMQTITQFQQDGSALGRLDSWQFALDRAFKDPLTGGGFACFTERLDSHSAYFQILAHHGFIALGLWLSLLFGTMLALERLRHKAILLNGAGWIRPYSRALQISLLGYSVGAVFLGAAYWDILYHLVSITAILKVQLCQAQAIQEGQEDTGHVLVIPAPSQFQPLTQV